MKFGWWQKNYIYGVEYRGWPKTVENGKKTEIDQNEAWN